MWNTRQGDQLFTILVGILYFRSINYQPAVSSVRNTLLDDLADNDSTQDFIVECAIDNTVNRVIESYRNILTEIELAAPDDAPEQDSHIEESAILSAITEHGLQSSSSSSGQEDNENETFPEADTQSLELDYLAEAAISSAIHSKGLSIDPSSTSSPPLSTGKSSPQR